MLRRRRRRLLTILAIVVALAVLLQRMLPHERAIPVETAAVSTGRVEVVATSEAGTVKARQRALLGVGRAGRVAAINYREGARAESAAVLLSLDGRTEANRLEAARRQLESLLVASKTQREANRSQRDTTAAGERAAAARVESAAIAVHLVRDEVAQLQIRAPFAGVVSRRNVDVGGSVIPGQPLLELVGDRDLYVTAPMKERDAAWLHAGLPARVSVGAYPGIRNGTLTRVTPLTARNRRNRTVDVEVALPNDPAAPPARPGMTAHLEVILGGGSLSLRVPTTAIVQEAGVYVVDRGRARLRDVGIGVRNWEWTQVLWGVSPGEQVVTSLKQAGLKPGARVATARDAGGP